MENIIDSINSIVSPLMSAHGFINEGNIYRSEEDPITHLYSEYEFELRKKIGGGYYYLNIRVHRCHKEISELINSFYIKRTQNDAKLSIHQKRRQIREIKKNTRIASLRQWIEQTQDPRFRNEARIWMAILGSLDEIPDFEKQFSILFETGQTWIKESMNLDFLIDWNKAWDSIGALSILKYLGDEERFQSVKNEILSRYESMKNWHGFGIISECNFHD